MRERREKREGEEERREKKSFKKVGLDLKAMVHRRYTYPTP